MWDAYLESKHGQFASNAGTPSALWDAAEQRAWPMYDLAGFYVADGAIPEVVRVAPVDARSDSVYQIVTRFWPAGTNRRDSATRDSTTRDSTTRDASTSPELTMTVYARRERERWVLANALTYKTSAWTRETRGRVMFHIAPSLRFNAPRAARAAAFVDSLATAFGVAPPPSIDYYVTESVDQALEILGVVVPTRFGANGGFAKPVNAQVFSGIPALGEEYRHEIAHVILLPIVRDQGTSLIASEGVSTWFGGTAGRDYRASVKHLDSLLSVQPQITLDKIVDDMSLPSEIRNVAGAVLAEMVHSAGGVDAVREYLRTPGPEVRETLVRVLRQPWPAIAVAWRERIRGISATGSTGV